MELKEAAKWAQRLEDMKKAVKELANYGEKAIPVLDEIMYVTAYQEVKSACTEAIKAIRGGQGQQKPAANTNVSAEKSAAAQESERGQEKEKEKKREKK